MERTIDRYTRYFEDYTGTYNVANVFGARVANTISASRPHLHKQAGHLIASNRVVRILKP
ncbi:hypothetical protein GGD55_004340 [Rhizobium giardinii]|uniref:Uncharacterized protein n=1 Tax=Rhizobium giardinii TaxID=56731 RepID=A0A7W8X8S8_9HYPH|nr:hypothetical protein [Rhizobium giardinii]